MPESRGSLVKLSSKEPGEAEPPPFDRVRVVSRMWLGDQPGPLLGWAPKERVGPSGIPWAAHKVAVVWGGRFPVCVVPCRGRKPLGDPKLDRPSLDGEELQLRPASRRRVEAAVRSLSVAILRSGPLTTEIRTADDAVVLWESAVRLRVDGDAPPSVLSLAIALWAADQLRGVWSVWAHLANGI